jgi:hypothetical protein
MNMDIMSETGTDSAKPSCNIQQDLTWEKKVYEKKKNSLIKRQENKKKMTHPCFSTIPILTTPGICITMNY